MQQPQPDEYSEYYGTYVKRVPAGDVRETLARQGDETLKLLRSIDEERAGSRYAEGKWSVKELVGHVLDCERIFAYRALAFARGEPGALPGFEQDDYNEVAGFDGRPFASIIDEFAQARASHLALFRSFTPEAAERRGIASGAPFSVRALVHVVCGHERHHVDVLRERYL